MMSRLWLLVAGLALTCACDRGPAPAPPPARLAALPARPYLMFVSVASDDTFNHVSAAPIDALDKGAFVSALSCNRVYFGGNRGMCLTPDAAAGDTPVWRADVFDEQFHVLHRLALSGAQSRVRVSPDGHRAATTVFESGHSYAEHGFSTRTMMWDLTTGMAVGDLEQFTTRRDGRPFRARDFNFWGVTFARDSDTFYATLDTSGITYLVKGSVAAKAVEVLREGVECPSLSPDNTRIAFKKRIGTRSRGWWQLAVVDLASMTETLVSTETRSLDDQVEWLDDRRVVYYLTGGATAAD